MKKLILSAIILSIVFTCSGCAIFRQPKEKIIVISADRYQYPMTNEIGISGWFVPNAVLADYQEALVELKYYKDKANTEK